MNMSVKSWLGALRVRLLAYRANYDRSANEAIVSAIHTDYANELNDKNDFRRRLVRTIAHYRAQLKLRPFPSIFLFEILSTAALPIYLLWTFAKGIAYPQSHRASCDGVQLVFGDRFNSNPNIFQIPVELQNDDIRQRLLGNSVLYWDDIKCVLHLFWQLLRCKSPYPVQLSLKCARDLAQVRFALRGLNPRYVIVYWEFSCSITFLTMALSAVGTSIYNVMHGDKDYFAKHAFFETDRCYCWNAFYEDLFRQEYVRADFRLFENPAFHLTEQEAEQVANCSPDRIGFIAPNLETLGYDRLEIGETIEKLASEINDISVKHPTSIRPHPHYTTDFKSLQSLLVPTIDVAWPTDTLSREFVLDHAVIIGTTSTVLLEAAHLGRHVILIRTGPLESMETYHYIYGMSCVTVCEPSKISQTLETILDGKRE